MSTRVGPAHTDIGPWQWSKIQAVRFLIFNSQNLVNLLIVLEIHETGNWWQELPVALNKHWMALQEPW